MQRISKDNISEIKKQIQTDLPGSQFQNLMSPIIDNDKYRIAPDDHKVACVMALIHPKNDGQLYITYIKRASSHPDDKHAGQIGFPGGKYEPEDKSMEACALREVEEELGIGQDSIDVLGELTSLYVFASNFLVYSFVGYLDSPPKYIPQIEEVAGVIEVPISHVIQSQYKTNKTIKLDEGISKEVPGYNINGHFLWGATAMITSELEAILRNVSGIQTS